MGERSKAKAKGKGGEGPADKTKIRTEKENIRGSEARGEISICNPKPNSPLLFLFVLPEIRLKKLFEFPRRLFPKKHQPIGKISRKATKKPRQKKKKERNHVQETPEDCIPFL